MRVGVIGGGGGVASSLKAANIEVVGCAAGGQVVEAGMECVGSYIEFLDALDYPRRYVLDLPAGPVVDGVIDEAYQTMEPGDVVIDPTPSYWGDTLRRYRRMRHRSLFYQDVACFGRPGGPSLVVAGDAKGLPLSRDVLEAWAKPGRLEPVAGAGFAHYLAMIEAYPGEVSPEAKSAFCPAKSLAGIGRAGWVLDDAVRLEAAIPLLAQALMQGLGDSLDDHASSPPPPRGAFVHPDDIL